MNKKILFAILVVVLVFLMMISQAWGFSKWFSPDDGVSSNSTTRWELWTVWDSDADRFNFWDAWEGELRGQPGRNINEFYCGIISWDSGLPGRYVEHDEDDYTFGSHDPHNLVPRQWYYSWMWLYPCYYQPSSFPARFESEWGLDFGGGGDPLPRDWEWRDYWIPGILYW